MIVLEVTFLGHLITIVHSSFLQAGQDKCPSDPDVAYACRTSVLVN